MNVNKLAMKFENLKNIVKNHSYLSLEDNGFLTVEYVREVLLLEENVIKLRLAKNTVKIIGLDLSMTNYTYDSVKITGKIESLTFDGESQEKGMLRIEKENVKGKLRVCKVSVPRRLSGKVFDKPYLGQYTAVRYTAGERKAQRACVSERL